MQINFSNYPNRIALLFSGGVESTLLYYLLGTESASKSLSLYVVDRHNQPLSKAHTVFEMVRSIINDNTTELKQLHLIEIANQRQVPFASRMLEQKYEAVVWGINQYPDDTSIRPQHQFDFVERGKMKLPLANLQKDAIIKLYYEIGIQHILAHTHSCGSDQDHPCGECFNCRERAWAYQRLGLPVDLGI